MEDSSACIEQTQTISIIKCLHLMVNLLKLNHIGYLAVNSNGSIVLRQGMSEIRGNITLKLVSR